jgi:hypothetical protein
MYSIFGIVTVIAIIAQSVYKKPQALSWSQLLLGTSMLFAGGPLDATGQYTLFTACTDYTCCCRTE